jgi:hypothetical protein
VVNPEDQKVPGRDFSHAGVATEPDWIDHTPGEPMPCEPVQKVRVRFRGGTKDIGRARQFFWGTTPYTPDGEVIQWKPAQ